MAISNEILPRYEIVYIRYEGRMGIAESTEAMGRYVQHPDFRAGMKQCVGRSAVTDWEHDLRALMQHLAQQDDLYDDPSRPTLIACLAPDDAARSGQHRRPRPAEQSARRGRHHRHGHRGAHGPRSSGSVAHGIAGTHVRRDR